MNYHTAGIHNSAGRRRTARTHAYTNEEGQTTLLLPAHSSSLRTEIRTRNIDGQLVGLRGLSEITAQRLHLLLRPLQELASGTAAHHAAEKGGHRAPAVASAEASERHHQV